jgi:hypothetical protein
VSLLLREKVNRGEVRKRVPPPELQNRILMFSYEPMVTQPFLIIHYRIGCHLLIKDPILYLKLAWFISGLFYWPLGEIRSCPVRNSNPRLKSWV